MPEGKHVSSSQHIVIAKDVLPDALATVKVLAGAQPVTVIPSFAGDESLAADLAASCTIFAGFSSPRPVMSTSAAYLYLRWECVSPTPVV
jgi:hypothetical protein